MLIRPLETPWDTSGIPSNTPELPWNITASPANPWYAHGISWNTPWTINKLPEMPLQSPGTHQERPWNTLQFPMIVCNIPGAETPLKRPWHLLLFRNSNFFNIILRYWQFFVLIISSYRIAYCSAKFKTRQSRYWSFLSISLVVLCLYRWSWKFLWACGHVNHQGRTLFINAQSPRLRF